MNIKEFINAIRNRPMMYVEEMRLDYIYYLVIGYLRVKSFQQKNSAYGMDYGIL